MRISSDAIDTASVDAALRTTRAVRRRLDLQREVDQQLILDCIDVAEQAPTGGNQGSRRWMVVRDPALKAELAELYLATAGNWMIETRDRLAGSGHHNEKVMASAAHLAEHLAEVPVIVIPTIIGRHDNSGKPGLFDSVIQSAWSFAVALRARGLGTTWTTAILNADDRIAELLGIPDDMTQIAMLPVAWTKGTEFGDAPRYPARYITYVNRFGRIYEHGPSVPMTLADGPGVVVEADVKAPIGRLWELVSDISMPAQFSDEVIGADWDEGVTEPAVGARFTGRNTHEARGEWQVPCYISELVEQRRFGWVSASLENPGARWRFELEPIAGYVRVRFVMHLGPGPSGITQVIDARPDLEERILDRRLDEHRANMERVVNGLATLATS
ncbi:MAG: nitroreductase family protein [Actinomycetota bacterium]